MDKNAILAELEALAGKLEVDVVYDHFTGDGFGAGGMCKVRGRWKVIMERRSSAGERVSLLARSLGRFDLGPYEISPEVRKLVRSLAGAAVEAEADVVAEEEVASPAVAGEEEVVPPAVAPEDRDP
ncbi:MAG: hypothetical protein IT371_02060 [Deltaproteobacteria bacterium]|nr:hypothetical protein [Deltaproteobacteria bacterium]